MVVELDAWAADDLRGRRLHSSQELTEHLEGGLTVRLRLSSLKEVARWILSMWTHPTVIQPEALRERLSKATQVLATRHGVPNSAKGGPDDE